jgi:hypothetical protein
VGDHMSEIDAVRNDGAESSPTHSRMVHFLWQQLPYIVALVLAIAGVAYTNASHQPLVRYWEFLALAIGVVCVINKWPEIDGRPARWRLVWTQALHWVAVLVAMNIMLVSGVQQLLPTPATSLVLLILLSLGTFLAGVSLLSLQIAFLGLAMGLTVPAISWLQQSVIFFLLGAVLLIGLGITFWLSQDRRPRATPADSESQMGA